MKDSRRFYKELANLFYAIAAADSNIRKEEKEKLQDDIRFAWKHYDTDTDRFGSDRAWLIEFEFETLEENIAGAAEAWEMFEAYFNETEKGIDHHTRVRIFNSARHIAEAVRKINEEELEYMVKLKKLLGV
ncbi:MAG TPA: hypothetical protein VF476_02700 [Chitinophagaceae bacterium]